MTVARPSDNRGTSEARKRGDQAAGPVAAGDLRRAVRGNAVPQCLDHVLITGEGQLRSVLAGYARHEETGTFQVG